jgi:hypothetical protein
MNMKRLTLRNLFIAVSLLITFKAANAAISPIPLSFDENSVQFIFTKVSDVNYVPLGTCFMVNVTTISGRS